MNNGIVFLHRLKSEQIEPRITEVYRYAGISIPNLFSNPTEKDSPEAAGCGSGERPASPRSRPDEDRARAGNRPACRGRGCREGSSSGETA